ncbi:MAG: outer membrane lipoprotein carrier protein LolA [Bacteroidetes bacterium]|nr:outer membrane lipoprotein carrier protein LolA [Bacteroidota bacterium]
MKKLILSLFIASCFTASAQDQDPKAKAILDEVSKTTKQYKTISADVLFTVFGKDKKAVDKPQTWKVQVSGQKFHLEIPGNSIVCDSKTLWNYNKDAKEVTIKNFDPESDEQNPSKIFTMYETGYKFKYDKEEKIGAVACDVIDLYPAVKPEKKKFHTVKIYIDKTKKQIVQMKMMMKDGGTQTYEIKSLQPNLPLADNLFVFDTKGLKSDQISDERD